MMIVFSVLMASHNKYEELQREAAHARLARAATAQQYGGRPLSPARLEQKRNWLFRLGWLAGLALLAFLLAATAAGQAAAVRQLHLPFLLYTPGNNNGPSQPANFFLPNKPGGSFVTTGLPKIAVDAAGGVHAVYAARTVDSTGMRPAYYAYCPANCTEVHAFATISLGDYMSYAELALDAQGRPRVLLVSGDSAGQQHYVYGECNGNCTSPAQWTLTLVTSGQISYFPSRTEHKMAFAVDALGRPGFVFFANPFGAPDGGTFYVACARACSDPNNWSGTKLSNDEWKNPALAYTQAGHPRLVVTFQEANTYAPLIIYLECNSNCMDAGNWYGNVLTGTATTGAMSDNVFAVAIDSQDRLGLALYPGTGSGGTIPANRLYYLACVANCVQPENWQLQDIGEPNFAGEGGVDLVFDQQNHPRVAYRIPAPTDEVAYAWCNADCTTSDQGWYSQIIPATAAAQQEFPFLPMQGCPSPTCVPPIPPCTAAFWDAGYWPSLALDPAGNPHIAFDMKHQHGGGGCTAGSFVRMARFVRLPQP